MIGRVLWSLCLVFVLSAPRLSFGAIPKASLARLTSTLTLNKARLQGVFKTFEKERKILIEEWIKLSQLPAPSGKETKRAKYLARHFRASGLKVSFDSVGNVIALKAGTKGKILKKVVLCAHMDTVFPLSTSLKVTRKGNLLFGPGIQDDTSGLMGLLALARAFHKHKIQFARDVWFVGTVQEEVGLRGARAFFQKHGKQVAYVISIDGGYGGVSYGAVGIHWYKAIFVGTSRHTLSSYKQPSTTLALAKAIARIYRIKVPRKPYLRRTWFNVGKIGGGSVVNAQAKTAWFTMDLRSLSAKELKKLERHAFAAIRYSAAQVGVRVRIETLQRLPAVQLSGMKHSRLVQAARLVLQSLGKKNPSLKPFGANDHCIALKMGIPGINIGVTNGGKIHSTAEFTDTTHLVDGLKQAALLVAIMASH